MEQIQYDCRVVPEEYRWAYVAGFADALHRGNEREGDDVAHRGHGYRIGYDAGITEYCDREGI